MAGSKGYSFFVTFLISIAVLILIITVSSGMGYIQVPFDKVSRIIFSLSGLAEFSENDLFKTIVLDVRLPRIITSVIVGGGLAVSGAVFQGILLNPLADPYTLGVSAGAAFGACIAILFPVIAGTYSIPVFAFAGAISTLFFVIYLSKSSGRISSNSLILSGIIVAAILAAGISFLKYTADDEVAVIIFWLMGSFVSKTWMDAAVAGSIVFTGILITIFYSRDLNLISLGEKSAASLGVDTSKVTLILLITASIMTAICVSVSGIIGFVGLLVPHIVRIITGPDNKKLIPISFLFGAALLLVADTVTRAVLPHEIPIGVLTALIGGPFFCYIFKKNRIERWIS
ncbi:MAG: iron ABC transporter permease [Deltaproteobacteria bacterium]|nr:iron ABC transporter permease [Deltaproteobacteria bacterium]